MSHLILQRTLYPTNDFVEKDRVLTKTQWVLRDQSIIYLKHAFQTSSKITSENLKKMEELIHANKAHELFEKKVTSYKPVANSNVIGLGNHQFLNLQECSCSVLDRVTKPGIHTEYEKQVLDKINTLSEEMTEIPISIFASGKLFGELVLLVKIANLLENKHWKGELKLFFIDTVYTSTQASTMLKSQENTEKESIDQTSVKNSKPIKIAIDIQNISMPKLGVSPEKQEEKAAKAIQSFFELLQQIVPPSIKIKNFFFESTKDYIKLATQNPKFKNLLQIGSDIGDNRLAVIELVEKTQSPNGLGMVVLAPRTVKNQAGEFEKKPDGTYNVQPMIFFMKTQADPIEYNWL